MRDGPNEVEVVVPSVAPEAGGQDVRVGLVGEVCQCEAVGLAGTERRVDVLAVPEREVSRRRRGQRVKPHGGVPNNIARECVKPAKKQTKNNNNIAHQNTPPNQHQPKTSFNVLQAARTT